jgi:hypothetical protein
MTGDMRGIACQVTGLYKAIRLMWAGCWEGVGIERR